ncbi:MAG: protease modulator HflK [Planctomycetota bacterium]
MKATESRPLRNAAIVVAVVFLLMAVANVGFPAALAFAAWGAVVASIHALYFHLQTVDLEELAARERREATRSEARWSLQDVRVLERGSLLPAFQQRWQLLCLGVGVVVTGWLIWRAWQFRPEEYSESLLQLGIAAAIGPGVLLALLGRYVVVLGDKLETSGLTGVAQLARLAFWVGLVVAAGMATLLYAQLDHRLLAGRVIAVATGVLVVDAAVAALLRLYRPAVERESSGPVGSSLILEIVLRRSNPWEEASQRIESSLGVKLGETWGFRFVRRALVPLVLATAFLAWGSTIATVVPVGHKGVRVEMGRFVEPAIGPGWHWTLPWPFETIQIVPTGRVDELVLGFERDTGQPILWAEKHYEGEQNLLVGAGDEFLTISMPVQFRIRDPLAYLMNTTEAQVALEHLAYRELLRVTAGRDSFAVMTDQRAEVSAALQTGLQAAADARGLGLEVVWVGFRDIHPPVDVTRAYQDVVSAEEERQTLVEQARAYAARTLPAAKQEADRLRATSVAAAQRRTMLATGEARRFQQLTEAQREHPELFRTRLQLEALESALTKPAKLVLATEVTPDVTLDARQNKEAQKP